ncbi:hypothetical protein [Flexivirga lutea]
MIETLGIRVDDELVDLWRAWFAPAEQLFYVRELPEETRSHFVEIDHTSLPLEIRDTFMAYSPGWALLSESQFSQLPAAVRRALATPRQRGYRSVWWPNRFAAAGDRPLLHYIEDGVRPSQHALVEDPIWERALALLPEAQSLAGTFARRSGPNCFGTVMAAAGVHGAADEWMTQEPFESWLAANATAVATTRHDVDPGIVYVWRQHDGLAVHACVTIGGGWVLNKPSQAWCSPRFIWPTRTAIHHARQPGARLHRYALQA